MEIKRIISRMPDPLKAAGVVLFIIAMYALADAVDHLPL